MPGFGTYLVTEGVVILPASLGGGQVNIEGEGDLTCVVPEPHTMLLLSTGVAGIGALVLKRHKAYKPRRRPEPFSGRGKP